MRAWRRGCTAAALLVLAAVSALGALRQVEAAATVSAAPASSQPTPLGEPFALTITIRGGVVGQEYPVVITWGDSATTSTSRTVANAARDSFAVSHTYGSAGTFNVFVSLPAEGASGSAQATIQSSNPVTPVLIVTPAPVTSPCAPLSTDPVGQQCYLELGISAFTLSGTIVDGDSNNWTVIIFWDDAGSPDTQVFPVVRSAAGPVAMSAPHVYTSYPNASGIRQRAIPTVDVVDDTFRRTSQTFPPPGLLIKDTTAPVVTVPGQGGVPPVPVVSADSPTGGTVVFGASATDNDPSMSFVCQVSGGPLPVGTIVQSGQVLPIGTSVINCIAADLAGNASNGSFSVTVADRTPPVFTRFPEDTASEAHDSNGITVTYLVQANDNVSLPANIVVSCDVGSGSMFPIGSTTVTCTARDEAANQVVKSFTVTVTADTTPPVLLLPPSVTLEATGQGTPIIFTATATDTGTPNPPVICSPASAALFPLGVTTVLCTATDAAGNAGTGALQVTLVDTTAPSLTVPANISLTAPQGASGAPVTYAITTSDTVDSAPVLTCTSAPTAGLQSGSSFPIGTTTISCSVRDASGNSRAGSFTVAVIRPADTTPPTITLPANITVSAPAGTTGAPVSFTVSATDIVDPAPVLTCTTSPTAGLSSGAIFPIGATTVTCTAKDASGNTSAPASFTVTVKAAGPSDTTAPKLQLPKNIKVLTANREGASVTFTANATDSDPAHPDVVCEPSPGTRFAVGLTTVNCYATDAAGNKASGSFTVTVTFGDTGACKKDGWKQFSDPSFKNQGDCVSFFATQGKNPPDGDWKRSEIVIGGVIAALASSLAVLGIVFVKKRRALE